MTKKGKDASEWFRVTRNSAEAIDIDIYGDIGKRFDWTTGEMVGIDAKSFLDTLREAKGKAVNLHINSGGGNVVDAYAMMTAISNHDGKVTAYVDGLAASAASYLIAAADEVVMSSVAWLMIHNATIFCWGDAEELRATADYLDKTCRSIAEIYAKKSGEKSVDEFLEAMAATTWFTAEEALEWGLIDTIAEAVAAAACVTTDKVTLNSIPDSAKRIIANLSPEPIQATEPVEGASDTLENIPSDTDEASLQEQPVAQERTVVVLGGKPYFLNRKEN